MKHIFAAALLCLALPAGAVADVLSIPDGRWRGTGTGQGFDGEERDIRCRLDVSRTETGRLDLQGSCAGSDGSQRFRLFLRPVEGSRQVQGGRLTAAGDEVEPYFMGERGTTGLTLNGVHGQSVISITLRREGELLHMVSLRERGRSIERSEVVYQRS